MMKVWFSDSKSGQFKRNFGYGKGMMNFRKWQSWIRRAQNRRKLNWEAGTKATFNSQGPQWALKNLYSRNSWRCRRGWGLNYAGDFISNVSTLLRSAGMEIEPARFDIWYSWLLQRIFPNNLGLILQMMKYESGVHRVQRFCLLQSLQGKSSYLRGFSSWCFRKWWSRRSISTWTMWEKIRLLLGVREVSQWIQPIPAVRIDSQSFWACW